MKTDLKTKWVDALRSEEYIQGQGTLKMVYKGKTCHCCLGVLLEVAGKEISMIPGKYIENFETSVTGRLTPDQKRDLFGTGYDLQLTGTLMEMNDVKDLDFNQIADWIEINVDEN